jgi:hypothetical protein
MRDAANQLIAHAGSNRVTPTIIFPRVFSLERAEIDAAVSAESHSRCQLRCHFRPLPFGPATTPRASLHRLTGHPAGRSNKESRRLATEAWSRSPEGRHPGKDDKKIPAENTNALYPSHRPTPGRVATQPPLAYSFRAMTQPGSSGGNQSGGRC